MEQYEVVIRNIRCFYGKHIVPLSPITLLVGENSTGKSTFLAALSTVCNPERFPVKHSFNESPFDLGNYFSIASYDADKKTSVDNFEVGYKKGSTTTTASYRNHRGRIELRSVKTFCPEGTLKINISTSGACKIKLELREGENITYSVAASYKLPKNMDLNIESIPAYIVSNFTEKKRKEFFEKVNPRHYLAVSSGLQGLYPEAYAVAPIRSKPYRIYDRLRSEFMPEGDHIPFTLASTLCTGEDDTLSEQLRQSLAKFGKESGLFDGVEIRQLGDDMRPAFRVMVNIAGQSVNLTDVGYGVNQCLPIVVQSLLSSGRSVLLLQQPEVHLHPKAQAALGSLFAQLTTKNAGFIIETHSDYLLDRLRMEVAKGDLSHELISILYFHREASQCKIYRIGLDSAGNLLDAPPFYRDFFIKEELDLLSGGDF